MEKDLFFRDLYRAEPDFRQLARQDADFACQLNKQGQIDFSDAAAVMQLTKTLLKVHFGLKIDLAHDRLCPPVPNRHNYILWLKTLLDSSSYPPPDGQLTGLDVGTGASCIYPLLGVVQRPWTFIATDIDAKNLEYVRANVAANAMEHRIRIVLRDADAALIPLDELGVERLDFVMTNPPFYASTEEMQALAQKKARPASSACTGAPGEMICPGGETAFVQRLLDESLMLRERVRWYTAMLGRVASLEQMVERLRTHKIDNYAVAALVQGSKTRRWVLGWSFQPLRPSQEASRGMSALTWKKVLPAPVVMNLASWPPDCAVGTLAEHLEGTLSKLGLLSWHWEEERLCGRGRSRQNVWGRAWRRKQIRHAQPGAQTAGERSEDRPESDTCDVFGFEVDIQINRTEVVVRLRWREGHNEALFESLSGFLKRELQNLKLNDKSA